jgi:hypothetical protein
VRVRLMIPKGTRIRAKAANARTANPVSIHEEDLACSTVTKDDAYLLLVQRCAKGTTILAAVGAVSGTVLSFELGLLWPQFIRHAGAVGGCRSRLRGSRSYMESEDHVPYPCHLKFGAVRHVRHSSRTVRVPPFLHGFYQGSACETIVGRTGGAGRAHRESRRLRAGPGTSNRPGTALPEPERR